MFCTALFHVSGSNGETVDVHLKSSIEGVVIKWASQISTVLSEDPSTAFSADANPEPKEGELSGPLGLALSASAW